MPLSETVLILMVLLTIGMITEVVFRKLPIPYTVLLVVIGMGLKSLSNEFSLLAPLQSFQLTPDLVLIIFLPALIFEAGFTLNARQLVKDIAPVLMLAIPAMLLSMTLIGLGIWGLLSIDLMLALLFGALISATDPVAVIALFKELGTPLRLKVMVEGESLLNDATAIVLFNILLGLVLFGNVGWTSISDGLLKFMDVFFFGALTGILYGLVFSWLMIKIKADTSTVLILSIILAYISYIFAEHALHVSGVMAVVTSAIVVGALCTPRLPLESNNALIETWELLALVSNTLLFLLLGLSVNIANLLAQIGSILVVVFVVITARACIVYSLVPTATRLFKLPRISFGERHIMWWGGLKGGLAIAIALSVPNEFENKQLLIDFTVGVVLFTLLVNATTLRPLIHWLRINKLSDDDRVELKRGITLARNEIDSLLNRFHTTGILSKVSLLKLKKSLYFTLWKTTPIVDKENVNHPFWLNSMRAEKLELENLYHSGTITHFIFMDINAELQNERDYINRNLAFVPMKNRMPKNAFVRIEKSILKKFREQDWASRLLTWYQEIRLTQHLTKDISRTLMAKAALNCIQSDTEIDTKQKEQLHEFYVRRLQYYQNSISEIKDNFPRFYLQFEVHFSSQAALMAAIKSIEIEHFQGSIGTRSYQFVNHAISKELESIKPASKLNINLLPDDYIRTIPLFSGLPEETIEGITELATPITYLTYDKIIEQHQAGHALYVIIHGKVSIKQKKSGKNVEVARLESGDFFGEMALLGNLTRNADVQALQPCTLLRITRKDILHLAKKFPEINDRLNEANRLRAFDAENY